MRHLESKERVTLGYRDEGKGDKVKRASGTMYVIVDARQSYALQYLTISLHCERRSRGNALSPMWISAVRQPTSEGLKPLYSLGGLGS
jgi:hypothetical protein